MLIFLCLSNIIIILLPKIIFSEQNCYEYSCEECSSPEFGSCTKCRDSFRILDGKCLCGFNSCSLCKSGFGGVKLCYVCREGYNHINGECVCPINNCEICALNGCQKCITGYYYNSSLNECLEIKEEDKILCDDINCDACFSEEKGACKYCKEGYYEKKGECIKLNLPINNRCDSNHYLLGKYCYEKCHGVECNIRAILNDEYIYLCESNRCLLCLNNQIRIFSQCNNTKECSLLEGCLNCIDNEECLVCMQGYYMIGGICKKCIEGCSVCINDNTCEYCLSGYILNEEKLCLFTNNFDYNQTIFKQIKEELIQENINNQIINQSNIVSSTASIKTISTITLIPTTTITAININPPTQIQIIIQCDVNCMNCNTKTGICSQCKSSYNLINNKCIIQSNPTTKPILTTKPKESIINTISIINKEPIYEEQNIIIPKTYINNIEQVIKIICEDNNCEICSEGGKICNKCNKDSKLYEGKCAVKCPKKQRNCVFCLGEQKCIECKQGYKLIYNFCKKKKNKFDFSFLYFLLLLLVIAFAVSLTHRYLNKNTEKKNHIKLGEG